MLRRFLVRLTDRLWKARTVPFVLILVVAMAIVLAGLAVGLMPESAIPDQLKWAKSLVQQTTSWTGLLEVLLLLAALLVTGYHFRQERAARFIQRFNSPEVMALRRRIDTWLAHYRTFAIPLRQRPPT